MMPALARVAGGGRRPVGTLLRAAAGLVVMPPTAAPGSIDLGTCVLVSLEGLRTRRSMTEEGVVIEVVAPRALPRSARVTQAMSGLLSLQHRYVVQCWGSRVLRGAGELLVVAL